MFLSYTEVLRFSPNFLVYGELKLVTDEEIEDEVRNDNPK